jgi:hypothetical protein
MGIDADNLHAPMPRVVATLRVLVAMAVPPPVGVTAMVMSGTPPSAGVVVVTPGMIVPPSVGVASIAATASMGVTVRTYPVSPEEEDPRQIDREASRCYYDEKPGHFDVGRVNKARKSVDHNVEAETEQEGGVHETSQHFGSLKSKGVGGRGRLFFHLVCMHCNHNGTHIAEVVKRIRQQGERVEVHRSD